MPQTEWPTTLVVERRSEELYARRDPKQVRSKMEHTLTDDCATDLETIRRLAEVVPPDATWYVKPRRAK